MHFIHILSNSTNTSFTFHTQKYYFIYSRKDRQIRILSLVEKVRKHRNKILSWAFRKFECVCLCLCTCVCCYCYCCQKLCIHPWKKWLDWKKWESDSFFKKGGQAFLSVLSNDHPTLQMSHRSVEGHFVLDGSLRTRGTYSSQVPCGWAFGPTLIQQLCCEKA